MTEGINWAALAKEGPLLSQPRNTIKIVPIKKQKVLNAGHTSDHISFSGDKSKLLVGRNARKEFRRIPAHPDYYISEDLVVRNQYGHELVQTITSNGSQISLMVRGKQVNFYRHELMWLAWPENAPVQKQGYFEWNGDVWRVIGSAPDYAIGLNSFEVLRLKNFQFASKGSMEGRRYLSIDGKQRSKSLRKLYLEVYKGDPGTVKRIPDFPEYVITSNYQAYSLQTMELLKQFNGRVYAEGDIRTTIGVRLIANKLFHRSKMG